LAQRPPRLLRHWCRPAVAPLPHPGRVERIQHARGHRSISTDSSAVVIKFRRRRRVRRVCVRADRLERACRRRHQLTGIHRRRRRLRQIHVCSRPLDVRIASLVALTTTSRAFRPRCNPLSRILCYRNSFPTDLHCHIL